MANAISPTRKVSFRSFETEILPQPRMLRDSAASLNDPHVTAILVATSDAPGVIFHPTPKVLNTSDSSGQLTR